MVPLDFSVHWGGIGMNRTPQIRVKLVHSTLSVIPAKLCQRTVNLKAVNSVVTTEKIGKFDSMNSKIWQNMQPSGR